MLGISKNRVWVNMVMFRTDVNSLFAIFQLKTVAKCEWGLEVMVELPTLTEYLLDRSTENEKECKEAKFEVVEAICASKRCANMFGNQNYLKFRQFVKEGPFYVDTQLNVAFEEA